MTNRHVILVGPMGAGKSTIGRHLAALLSRSFVDIDAEIERRCGADIPWIFDVEGEQGFRQRESNILEDVLSGAVPLIVATGGGAVLREDNRALLRRSGIVVYLSVSPARLYERTKKDKSRPLLQVEDRLGVIRRLVEEREPLYRDVADMVIPSGEQSPAKLSKKLAEALQKL